MKSYTDIEQSKTLSKILPLESADMHYATWTILDGQFIVSPNQGSTIESLQEDYSNQIIPCWSLAALLGVLPISINTLRSGKWNAMVQYDGEMIYEVKDNPIDACYEMILKLHELKVL